MKDDLGTGDLTREIHAGLRATVETQLEMGVPAVRNAFERLQAEGLDRDATLTAIVLVFGPQISNSMRKEGPEDFDEGYAQALDHVTAANLLAREDHD